MEKTNGVDIVVGLIPTQNRVDKYVVYKDGNIYYATPTELYRSMESGQKILGLRRAGSGVKLAGRFSHKSILGEESDDVWTLVRQHIYKNKRRFDLSDCVGNIRNISEDELKGELKGNTRKINGVYLRGEQLVIPKAIPITIEKEEMEV